MPKGGKPPLVDGSVLKELRSRPRRRLDGDWLAIDDYGHIGFFAGGDTGPVPRDAMPHAMPDAIEAIGRAVAVRRAMSAAADGYRASSGMPSEPVFDLPPEHEHLFDGYAHLVFASAKGEALRQAIADGLATEAIARDAFAVVYPTIGSVEYEAIHEAGACAGCRVLDMVDDPRPNAAEVLASMGFYVFRGGETTAPHYTRIASPTRAADLDDVEPIVRALAELVKLPVDFEARTFVGPRFYVSCD